MKICSLRNEKSVVCEMKSAVCEMTICSLRNDNCMTFSLRLLGYSKQKIPPQKAVSPRKFRLRGMRDVFVANNASNQNFVGPGLQFYVLAIRPWLQKEFLLSFRQRKILVL